MKFGPRRVSLSAKNFVNGLSVQVPYIFSHARKVTVADDRATSTLISALVRFVVCISGCVCRVDGEQPLMTAALRQQQKEARMEKYPRVILRVHFPERIMLQGVFNVRESGGQ